MTATLSEKNIRLEENKEILVNAAPKQAPTQKTAQNPRFGSIKKKCKQYFGNSSQRMMLGLVRNRSSVGTSLVVFYSNLHLVQVFPCLG